MCNAQSTMEEAWQEVCLKAPQLVNMPCNNIPGTFGECVMGGGFDS